MKLSSPLLLSSCTTIIYERSPAVSGWCALMGDGKRSVIPMEEDRKNIANIWKKIGKTSSSHWMLLKLILLFFVMENHPPTSHRLFVFEVGTGALLWPSPGMTWTMIERGYPSITWCRIGCNLQAYFAYVHLSVHQRCFSMSQHSSHGNIILSYFLNRYSPRKVFDLACCSRSCL